MRLRESLLGPVECRACDVVILAAAAVVLLLAAAHAAPVSALAPERLAMTLSNSTWELPFYASQSLTQTDAAIVHAVVIIHDSSRSARSAFSAGLAAVRAAGASALGTLVIAPQFLTAEDAEAYGLPDRVLRWQLLAGGADWEQGWDQGNDSDSAAGGASSFAVLDALLERLADGTTYPSLRTVVIAGLSLGAQFVNRYAAGSGLAETLRSQRQINVRYVVAAPSSYLYFDRQRPTGSSAGTFAVPTPSARAACPEWNSYRYGLDDLNSYMAVVGAAGLRDSYSRRTVTCVVGEDDHGGEQSCAARLQGRDRLARAQAYNAYLAHVFGDSISERHKLVIVPGLGHSWDLLSSPCGVALLLGDDVSTACGS